MTDRHFSYTVILECPIREDDADAIKQTILMIKGVAKVVPQVTSPELYYAVETARRELGEKLWDVLYLGYFVSKK